MMNQREAKIGALWLAYGVLRGVDDVANDLPEQDSLKIQIEFEKLIKRLHERAIALERHGRVIALERGEGE
jgi:hypothetical protein